MNERDDEEENTIIKKLINKPNLNENVVSKLVIDYYNENSHYEYATYDFLEYLKRSYLNYLELIDTINEVNITFKDEKIKQNKFLLENLENFRNNVVKDKSKLTIICKNLCNLYSSIRSKSDSLSKVKRTIMNSKDEKAILKNNLEYLLNFQTQYKLNSYIIKLSNFKLHDCINSIEKCSSFYYQLLNTIHRLVDLCNSHIEKNVKFYLKMIIEKLKKDHDSLKIIKDNLINLYCI